MARENQNKEIDGHKYVCTMMPVRKATKTWSELVAVLGQPMLETVADALADKDQDSGVAIARGISVAINNLQGDVGEHLVEVVFDGVMADGVGPLEPWNDAFDAHFRGRVLSMYKVWAWAVQVNFQDFLDGAQLLGLKKFIAMAKDMAKKEFLGHPTSTASTVESGTSSRVSN